MIETVINGLAQESEHMQGSLIFFVLLCKTKAAERTDCGKELSNHNLSSIPAHSHHLKLRLFKLS